MIILRWNCSPLQQHSPSLLWSLRMHPNWVCDLFALTLRSGLNTVQGGEAVQHCHTRERNAELLDISQGPRVENQFPFHLDLSLVPTVVSSTTTSFLSHPYWVTSTPLLPLFFFHMSAYPSNIFYPARTEYHPPLSRRSYSHSSSIFSSAVYTDLTVNISPLQMCIYCTTDEWGGEF